MRSIAYKFKMILVFFMVMVFSFMNTAEAKGTEDIILNLSGTGENPLHIFTSEDGMWFPGKTVEKSFTIKNKTGYRCSINNMKLQMKSVEVSGKKLDNTEALKSQRIEKFNQAMKCTIKYNSGFNKKVIFQGDFKSFANGGKNIDIEEIPILNNEEKNFSIDVTMDEAADNSTQGIKAEFDIIFNFYSTDNSNNNSGGPYISPGTNSNEKPVITLIGDKEVDVEWGQNYVDAGATAFDKEDGDITKNIITKVNGKMEKIDTSKLGTSIITYNVSDSDGNKAEEVKRTVVVKEKVKEKRKESILERIGILPKTGEKSPLKWYIIGSVIIVLGILIKKK